MAKKDKLRLNLEFPPAVADELERMIAQSHSASRVELFRKALRLFELYLDNRDAGGKLLLQQKDGTTETVHIL